jgi:ribosomal-protein-alanine N-acetyltransferase
MTHAVSKTENIFANLPELETRRLVLRKFRLEDADEVFEYASDPEVTRYTIFDFHTDKQQTINFLNSVLVRYGLGEPAPWAIWHKGHEKVIGGCGFSHYDREHARAEVGYAIARYYWGHGFTSEAMQAVIHFGFEQAGLNRIEARCIPAHTPSQRVMEKVGMKFESLQRQHSFFKGGYQDLTLFVLLKSEFEAGAGQLATRSVKKGSGKR